MSLLMNTLILPNISAKTQKQHCLGWAMVMRESDMKTEAKSVKSVKAGKGLRSSLLNTFPFLKNEPVLRKEMSEYGCPLQQILLQFNAWCKSTRGRWGIKRVPERGGKG